MSTLPFDIRNDFARALEQKNNATPATNNTVETNIVATEGGYQLTADINFVTVSGGGSLAVILPFANQQQIGKNVIIKNMDGADMLVILPFSGQCINGIDGGALIINSGVEISLVLVKYNDWYTFEYFSYYN